MRKRTKMFVDYPVQGSLVRQLLMHWLFACVVMFVYLFCMQIFTGGMHKSLGAHLSELWKQYGILLLALATVFPVFVFDSLRLSHRFVGPMIPLGRALERLSKGETISPVQFRQSDFWKHLSKDLNSVAQKLDLVSNPPSESAAE